MSQIKILNLFNIQFMIPNTSSTVKYFDRIYLYIIAKIWYHTITTVKGCFEYRLHSLNHIIASVISSLEIHLTQMNIFYVIDMNGE